MPDNNKNKSPIKPISLIYGGSNLLSFSSSITKGALSICPIVAKQAGTAMTTLTYSGLTMSGIGFLVGAISDAIKLKELWTHTGHYAKLSAEQHAYFVDADFKKRKTTAYVILEQAMMLAITIIQILVATGVLAATSLALPATLAVYVVFQLTRQIASLVRTAKEYKANQNEIDFLAKTNQDPERLSKLRIRQAELDYKVINNVVKMGGIIIMSAIVVTLALTTGPLATVVVPAALLAMIGMLALYKVKIKPMIKTHKIARATTLFETPIQSTDSSALFAMQASTDHLEEDVNLPLLEKKGQSSLVYSEKFRRKPLSWLKDHHNYPDQNANKISEPTPNALKTNL